MNREGRTAPAILSDWLRLTLGLRPGGDVGTFIAARIGA
ncbi:hypothetical protein J2X06_002571 [Lysobacter niastensis]|uniref:Uncharacterized protein n=1 Tax=Lysobacter niastensis TaxID=380629 RepID=A0ABU1WDE2_9GAMM|nr:hypothetical protein [Lysobacter niastensis]